MKSILHRAAIKLTTSLSMAVGAVLILLTFVSISIYRSPAAASMQPTTDSMVAEFVDRQINHHRNF
ncbi:MAG TPA: hypothetical protein V6D22_13395 [Candidatus Obscuribacterales bacterium]